MKWAFPSWSDYCHGRTGWSQSPALVRKGVWGEAGGSD